jgi:NADH:ubiquinone oxidoreductase subunit K
MLEYLAAASVALVAIAITGIIVDRHLIVTMLAIELMFVASSILLVSFFSFAGSPEPDAVAMLVGIWAVAASVVIATVTLYVCMKAQGFDFDMAKLSRLKW